MKKTKYEVTRFDVNDEYYVEVTIVNGLVEFYLCMNRYAYKYAFGDCHYIKDNPESEWENYINICIDEAIYDFERNVFGVYESGFLEEHGYYEEYDKSYKEYYGE